ncbi:hypothetical protein ACFVS2_20845 [Brevibacillus sp. NPDC058079]|uniref:hypothetical protein n=1 Tax=Brevibacillus sp. NPDC058079 TaxID=3346330 RepID=UPI0036E2464B
MKNEIYIHMYQLKVPIVRRLRKVVHLLQAHHRLVVELTMTMTTTIAEGLLDLLGQKQSSLLLLDSEWQLPAPMDLLDLLDLPVQKVIRRAVVEAVVVVEVVAVVAVAVVAVVAVVKRRDM